MEALARRVASRRQRIATAFAVLLGLVIAVDAVVLVVNQLTLPPETRRGVRPRSIAELARTASNDRVSGMFAVWYLIGERIPGARVRLSIAHKVHRWGLEKVGRVEVELSAEPIELSRADAERLAARADASGQFYVSSRLRPIQFVFEPGERNYVIAATPGGKMLLLVPERTWAEAGERAITRP